MTHRSGFTRRDLFRASAALPALGIGCSVAGGAKTPKNIIFMVADGMSPGVLPLAEIFSNVARKKGTAWHELLGRKDVAHGMFDQASLDAHVTDSSAASSAWGSGVRICNGAVNMLPDGRALTPIATVARECGKRVGLVTTTTMTHATPAGFAAVHEKRGAEAEMATQYIENVDVLMGGGLNSFAADRRKDGRDLIGEYEAAGFSFVENRSELQAAAGGSKLLGLFAGGQVPYHVDRHHSGDNETPSLAECTGAALGLLDNQDGFLLQVEGGRVDHAAHASDAAAMLWEQLDFDDAVRVAVDYAAGRGDTLVVLCSDHGNSNPGMIEGKGFRGEEDSLACLAEARCSFGELKGLLTAALTGKGSGSSASRVREVVEGSHGVSVSDREASLIADAAAGQKKLTLNKQFDSFNGVLGQSLANHLGVGWMSKGHTTDYTISTAVGPGAGEFAGLIRNTEVFEILTRYMGSEFRNLSMSEEEARGLMARGGSPAEVHWV